MSLQAQGGWTDYRVVKIKKYSLMETDTGWLTPERLGDVFLAKRLWTDDGDKEVDMEDFTPMFLLMSLFCMLEIVCKMSFRRLGKFLILRLHGNSFLEENPARLECFTKRGYMLVCHLFLTFSAWWIFRQERWWYWGGYYLAVIRERHQTFSWGVRFYLNLNAADYLYKTLILVIRANLYGKSKDFGEMLYHHVLSFFMTVYAYMFGNGLYAVMFLYISNQTDCLTYSARMTNDIKWHYPMLVMLPSMLVVWIYNRVFFNPYVLISSGYCSLRVFFFDDASPNSVHTLVVLTLFLGLYILHVHWIFGLMKVAYYSIKGGVHSHVDRGEYSKNERARHKDIQEGISEEQGAKVEESEKV